MNKVIMGMQTIYLNSYENRYRTKIFAIAMIFVEVKFAKSSKAIKQHLIILISDLSLKLPYQANKRSKLPNSQMICDDLQLGYINLLSVHVQPARNRATQAQTLRRYAAERSG